MNMHRPTVEQPDNAAQAVDTAVAAAVADARVKTKEEVEAASAAKKAAADQQLLRELEDKTQALTNQLNSATEQLRSTDTALRFGLLGPVCDCSLHAPFEGAYASIATRACYLCMNICLIIEDALFV